MTDAIRRALRTLLWSLAGSIPVIPATAALFDISAKIAGQVTGVMTLVVVVLTGVINGLEDRGTIPALLKSPSSDGADPVGPGVA